MAKKKVLVLDRGYAFKYMNSDVFDVILVCLQYDSKVKHLKEGLNVVGCFEEEYNNLPTAQIPSNYLIHSFDSDRFLNKYSWAKRQEILGKEISFWRQVLDEYRPDCIVNEVVTIEWMEVMSIEANRRGIPYYRIALLPFDKEDVWVDNNAFDSRLGETFWNSIKPTKTDYDKAREYINLTRGEGRKPYFIKQKQKNNVLLLFKFLKNVVEGWFERRSRKFVYEDYYEQSKLMLSICWRRLIHNKYDIFEPEENVDYFFYPVHYEPEATIEYFSYYFNDQPMVIGRIAHSLKTNQMLILKEHPQQRGMLLTKAYRDLKKKYSNLIYLPGDISSYDIYPHIKCLVTLCGTAGFESWICQRPVIEFGEVYYSDFPGIIHCESFKQLYNVIRNDEYIITDDDTILEYVAKMYHVLVEAFPIMRGGQLNLHDCQTITKAIESFLS